MPAINLLLVRLKRFSKALALLSVLIGIIVIPEGEVYPGLLNNFLSLGSAVKVYTALIAITAGISLFILHFKFRLIARTLLLGLLLMILIILVEYFLERNFNISQLDVSGSYRQIFPHELSVLTIFYSLLMISSLLFLSFRRLSTAQLFAILLFILVYATIPGQIFCILNFHRQIGYPFIDFPLALCFLLLTTGVLFFHPGSGWTDVLAGNFLGSIAFRYVFGYLLGTTPIFTAVYLYFINERNIAPLPALIFILIFSAIITVPLAYLLIKRINKVDQQLKEANNELMNSNQELWSYNNQLMLSKDQLNRNKHELSDLNQQLIQGSKELSLKNEELKRINENLDNLIHIISHDLKTPIVSLDGSVRLFEKKLSARLTEQEMQLLKMVERSVVRLKATISELTQVIRGQQASENKEDVRISEVLDEVRLELEQKIHEAGALIWVSSEADTIHYVRIHLKSILHNLLSNAIKYRSPQRYLVVEIKTRMTEGGLQLIFKDNGLGIPAANLSQLFVMFKRFHQHVEGTGLGLSIVKRIIENEGGSINVESEEGTGTVFTIYFKQ